MANDGHEISVSDDESLVLGCKLRHPFAELDRFAGWLVVGMGNVKDLQEYGFVRVVGERIREVEIMLFSEICILMRR